MHIMISTNSMITVQMSYLSIAPTVSLLNRLYYSTTTPRRMSISHLSRRPQCSAAQRKAASRETALTSMKSSGSHSVQIR